MKKAPHVRSLVFGIVIAGSGFAIAYQVGGSLKAQSLVAPSFTAAQPTAGQAAYAQNCASCHGANLDDGEFAPPLKGVEFRRRLVRPAGAITLFDQDRDDAAGGAGFARRADARRDPGLPDVAEPARRRQTSRCRPTLLQLKAMLLPGFAGGPSGGLSGGVAIPPAPPRGQPARHDTRR